MLYPFNLKEYKLSYSTTKSSKTFADECADTSVQRQGGRLLELERECNNMVIWSVKANQGLSRKAAHYNQSMKGKCSNCRPIRFISQVDKMLENIIRDRTNNHSAKYGLISKVRMDLLKGLNDNCVKFCFEWTLTFTFCTNIQPLSVIT